MPVHHQDQEFKVGGGGANISLNAADSSFKEDGHVGDSLTWKTTEAKHSTVVHYDPKTGLEILPKNGVHQTTTTHHETHASNDHNPHHESHDNHHETNVHLPNQSNQVTRVITTTTTTHHESPEHQTHHEVTGHQTHHEVTGHQTHHEGPGHQTHHDTHVTHHDNHVSSPRHESHGSHHDTHGEHHENQENHQPHHENKQHHETHKTQPDWDNSKKIVHTSDGHKYESNVSVPRKGGVQVRGVSVQGRKNKDHRLRVRDDESPNRRDPSMSELMSHSYMREHEEKRKHALEQKRQRDASEKRAKKAVRDTKTNALRSEWNYLTRWQEVPNEETRWNRSRGHADGQVNGPNSARHESPEQRERRLKEADARKSRMTARDTKSNALRAEYNYQTRWQEVDPETRWNRSRSKSADGKGGSPRRYNTDAKVTARDTKSNTLRSEYNYLNRWQEVDSNDSKKDSHH